MTFDWASLGIGLLLGAALAFCGMKIHYYSRLRPAPKPEEERSTAYTVLPNIPPGTEVVHELEWEPHEEGRVPTALPRFGKPSSGARAYDPRYWERPMNCAGNCGPLLAGQMVYGIPLLDEDDNVVDSLLICEVCVAIPAE